MPDQAIHTAPPGSGTPVLGKTLTGLLYDACSTYGNPRALNQPTGEGWTAYSLDAFRRQSEETACGLRDVGLERGDKVAFYMESDVYFCVADMGCLLAGLIDVPIYLTSAPDAIRFIIHHAEAKALFVADLERLGEIADLLQQTPGVGKVIVAERGGGSVPDLPEGVELLWLDDLRERGRARLAQEPGIVEALRAEVQPHDLATIIYTSGTTGQPKGVMLTHENISFDAMTSFTGLTGYRDGPEGEIAISFLPLTHIFARALHYGFVAHGTTVYFTTPSELVEALGKVRPTAFATVPRVLEKVYARIQERINDLTGLQRLIGDWALELAQAYDIGDPPTGLEALPYLLADKLVYRKWRDAIGGRVRFVICGGAALNAELANVFGAAGVPVYQGYGLTETSPVISYNRPGRNRAGTVGELLPSVEVMIAEDGEILTRGPHVMPGYFKEEEKTREVIDEDGWFHTGDIGEFTEDGFLRITDRKKDLFKLSTGKYVMPQPLENELGIELLIENAVVVGAGYKFCTALIFPDQEALRTFARDAGLDAEQPIEDLLEEPAVIEKYQELVDEANAGMDHWSTIKRFILIPEHLTVENGLLTPTLKVKRPKVRAAFEVQIKALYDASDKGERGKYAGVVVG